LASLTLDDIVLPKWPRLLVSGIQVKPEQANEILIRTNNWFGLSVMHKEWPIELTKILKKFNFPIEPSFENEGDYHNWSTKYSRYIKIRDEWLNKYKVIKLNYLMNSRIYSNSIAGKHGWCNWDGEIYTANYNVGKWPTIEDLYGDWMLIAQIFPYLVLDSQILSEDYDVPLVRFIIHKGEVIVDTKSKTLIALPEHITDKEIIDSIFCFPGNIFSDDILNAARLNEALLQIEYQSKC